MTKEITVRTSLEAPIEKVWQYYTEPEHITQWNAASDDWHSPHAENDLRPDGHFSFRMEAKDESVGFDFEGTYREVEQHKRIAYTIDDGRLVEVTFDQNGPMTEVVVRFEAEETNSPEMQREGWQSILDNFKQYVEHYS